MRSTIRKKPPKKKPGRKPKGGRVYTVKLTDDVADQLRKLGSDENGKPNLTLGIERAVHRLRDVVPVMD
jgi:hypothetical protein